MIVSYRSRERRRRAKIAKAQVRERHGETMKGRHYLTLVKRTCCCNSKGCGKSLRKGDECVYRREPREILCPECAQRMKLKYRTSQSWDAWRWKQRRKQSRS
jgi:hypothetical protein